MMLAHFYARTRLRAMVHRRIARHGDILHTGDQLYHSFAYALERRVLRVTRAL